mmetsp:Transcript_48728/g.72766  ORF Transcript_48728/g.72766 Transcript_48728/m.72766 type:complete len:98 (-) Transcript_48728:207-500(-)
MTTWSKGGSSSLVLLKINALKLANGDLENRKIVEKKFFKLASKADLTRRRLNCWMAAEAHDDPVEPNHVNPSMPRSHPVPDVKPYPSVEGASWLHDS